MSGLWLGRNELNSDRASWFDADASQQPQRFDTAKQPDAYQLDGVKLTLPESRDRVFLPAYLDQLRR